MNEYYSLFRLFTNFFSANEKLLEKKRIGAKIKKIYEPPLTPYRRVLADPSVSIENKEKLTELFNSLDPILINKSLVKLHSAIISHSLSRRE